MRLWYLAITVLTTVGLVPGAAAQDVPYENHLLGDRALGFGGSFVALADDATAIFHNPAGLSQLRTDSISGSLWVIAYRSRSQDLGYVSDEGGDGIVQKGLTSIPSMLAGVLKFGRKDAFGRRHHAIGATLLTPRNDSMGYSIRLEGDAGTNTASLLQVNRNDESRWVGLSYSYRLEHNLSLGLSAFAAFRDIEHREALAHVANGTLGSVASSLPLVSLTSVDADFTHLVLRLGALWDPERHWRVGVMFQPPAIQLAGTATLSRLNSNAVPPDQLTFDNDVDRDVDATRPMPWELRGGVSWRSPLNWAWSADVSVFGPSGSESDPVAFVEGQEIYSELFAPASYLQASLRASAGFEYVFDRRIPFRGGVFFQTPGEPEVPDVSDRYFAPSMTTYGLAVSMGTMIENQEISVGLGASTKVGDAMTLISRRADGVSRYESTGASESTLVIFISGGSRIVEAIAEEIEPHLKRVLEPIASDEADEVDEADTSKSPEAVPE